VTQVPDAHPKSPVPAFHRVDRVLGVFFFFLSFGSFEWFGRASARHYPCLDPGLKERSQNVVSFCSRLRFIIPDAKMKLWA
jgi:hypothetical protein